MSNPQRVAGRLPQARSGSVEELPRAPDHWVRDVVETLLASGDINAVSQPIIRLGDGQTVGYEVLARSRSFASTPPDQWLQMAESAGRRVEVELACLRAAAALGTPPGGARLFLNASAGLLLDPRLDALLTELPEHVLEVTEHEQIADYNQLTERLRSLSSRGSLLAVDDVGAGYANMAHVLRLSPQFIKIDRSIVSGVHGDRERRALISALVAFSVACGAQTIAEGVEDRAELDALTELGVDLAQGYLIARPGKGWPTAAQIGIDTTDRKKLALLPLASRLEHAGDLQTLADVATGWLYDEHRVMPSIYVELAGSLRCLSRRGQWIVHDGMAPGVGVTGTAFARDAEIWVPDVRADPTYRAAIPGVRSEYCVPLRSGGRPFGVLNVEAFTELGPVAREHTREAARLIEERLLVLGARKSRDSALRELTRYAAVVANAADADELGAHAVAAAVAVSGLSSAVLWWAGPEGVRLGGCHGPASQALSELDSAVITRLFAFTEGVTSCHTAGGHSDLSATFVGASFESIARAMLVVPIRVRGTTMGLLVTTSARSRDIDSDAVEATELLGLQIATVQLALAAEDPG
ncbi:MAG: response regulator receiver modulated diguanylate phosphodiesterase [Mycobacterium sp.]|nr:response regulator receiver modulated diguanylate phosphodiesterase [Mycobacterium sp.]